MWHTAVRWRSRAISYCCSVGAVWTHDSVSTTQSCHEGALNLVRARIVSTHDEEEGNASKTIALVSRKILYDVIMYFDKRGVTAVMWQPVNVSLGQRS